MLPQGFHESVSLIADELSAAVDGAPSDQTLRTLEEEVDKM
jgi:hypothetical protein